MTNEDEEHPISDDEMEMEEQPKPAMSAAQVWRCGPFLRGEEAYGGWSYIRISNFG